jgi:hypothetical protein
VHARLCMGTPAAVAFVHIQLCGRVVHGRMCTWATVVVALVHTWTCGRRLARVWDPQPGSGASSQVSRRTVGLKSSLWM